MVEQYLRIKKIVHHAILLFAITLVFPDVSFAQRPIEGVVVNVAAGDIVTVWEKGKQYKIRLYGIDTPELKQKFGPKAKKYISDVVFNKDLTVIQKDIDKYGTIVGMIYIADKCLNEALVKNGVAWVYKKYCREDFCNNWLQLEQEARENKLGLWSDDKPIPPWEFLKRQSKQHNNQ